jgi:hypothetical protein
MVNDESERDKYEHKKKHVSDGVGVCGKVNIKLRGKNDKRYHKGKNWLRPYKDKHPKEHKECMPKGECNSHGHVVVHT